MRRHADSIAFHLPGTAQLLVSLVLLLHPLNLARLLGLQRNQIILLHRLTALQRKNSAAVTLFGLDVRFRAVLC